MKTAEAVDMQDTEDQAMVTCCTPVSLQTDVMEHGQMNSSLETLGGGFPTLSDGAHSLNQPYSASVWCGAEPFSSAGSQTETGELPLPVLFCLLKGLLSCFGAQFRPTGSVCLTVCCPVHTQRFCLFKGLLSCLDPEFLSV